MLKLRDMLNAIDDGENVILVANDDECYSSLGNHKKENWLLALDWFEEKFEARFTVTQLGRRYNCTCLRLGEIRSGLTKKLEVLGNDAATTNAFKNF